ncbi:hydantoinase/oxoprolinase family protein [Psychromarinibacter halotolerans]|uniref:Hydantoinase/oxoprolinase family protein n=1 Tax=Psychromarinibacter halotolerans TaxID=1775175 RepID=A0ABV7GMF7_9RHOB|nr:hydantoinase/oxoprolinase family protein [Psychromarinibacter halotolerans]MDF0597394.1 hydantoinase/oxoprolinase family protein [Psychromarinibacter halotolerans]
MTTRIGVDIGGTFTDLVYFDDQIGESREGKVPTVPDAPEKGVINAVREHVPADVIGRAKYFLHGTTVGLNALLERRGAKVGLITTEGMRDVLELRRADRADMYDMFWAPKPPLVPRYLRLEAVERVLANGQIHKPLDEAALAPLFETLKAEGVDCVAICLMHAYANPVHEKRVAELLRASGFAGRITISSEISGEYREYERTSTAVVDAFVRARMADYLANLEAALRELGFTGECLITRSGGGSMTFAEAQLRPFETIMSGPVAGVQGASELGRLIDAPALVTADVGGTSFDAALVLDSEPIVLFEGQVDGMPLQTSWVDVRSIGSGGGSLAYVDEGGLMRVGPHSAGAVPGPACYGKGGTQPTTTDAAAYLGMLGPGNLASGINLDFDAAKAAFQPLTEALNEPMDKVVTGVLRISSSAMANTLRDLAFERGLDLREMTLLPFGGAGPMMATLLADELKMQEIIVPQLAGNFSAWGLLGADKLQDAARTRIMPLTEDTMGDVAGVLSDLFDEIRGRGESSGIETAQATASLDLRYSGQEHWLTIPLDMDGEKPVSEIAAITDAFEGLYQQTFGAMLDEPVEIMSVRAALKVPLPARQIGSRPRTDAPSGEAQTFRAYSFNMGAWTEFRIMDRSEIAGEVRGPMIITDTTTTIYVDAGWSLTIGKMEELRMRSVPLDAETANATETCSAE